MEFHGRQLLLFVVVNTHVCHEQCRQDFFIFGILRVRILIQFGYHVHWKTQLVLSSIVPAVKQWHFTKCKYDELKNGNLGTSLTAMHFAVADGHSLQCSFVNRTFFMNFFDLYGTFLHPSQAQ